MAVIAERNTYMRSASFLSKDLGEQVRCGFIFDPLFLEVSVLSRRGSRGNEEVKCCQYVARGLSGVVLPESRKADGASWCSSLLVYVSSEDSYVVSRLSSYSSASKLSFADIACSSGEGMDGAEVSPGPWYAGVNGFQAIKNERR